MNIRLTLKLIDHVSFRRSFILGRFPQHQPPTYNSETRQHSSARDISMKIKVFPSIFGIAMTLKTPACLHEQPSMFIPNFPPEGNLVIDDHPYFRRFLVLLKTLDSKAYYQYLEKLVRIKEQVLALDRYYAARLLDLVNIKDSMDLLEWTNLLAANRKAFNAQQSQLVELFKSDLDEVQCIVDAGAKETNPESIAGGTLISNGVNCAISTAASSAIRHSYISRSIFKVIFGSCGVDLFYYYRDSGYNSNRVVRHCRPFTSHTVAHKLNNPDFQMLRLLNSLPPLNP